MPTNDFLPWAISPAAAVESQAAYASEAPNGRGPGILPKESYNKAMRQGTVMAAAVGQFINSQGGDALDDGNVPELCAALLAAIGAVAGSTLSVPVTSVARNNVIYPGPLTLTTNLNLGPGTWLIDATAAIFSAIYNELYLSVDGVIIQTQPSLGDLVGSCILPMGGFATVVVAAPGRAVPVTFSQQVGGTCNPVFVKAIAQRIA